MSSKIRKWLEENKHKYSDRTQWINDCVANLKTSKKIVYKYSAKAWPHDQANSGRKGLKNRSEGRSMNRSEFMAKHDPATKTRLAIQKGILTLVEAENPDEDPILENTEFRLDRCTGVNVQLFRSVADEPQFRDNQFRQGDKIFWTTKRTKRWALEHVSRAREL